MLSSGKTVGLPSSLQAVFYILSEIKMHGYLLHVVFRNKIKALIETHPDKFRGIVGLTDHAFTIFLEFNNGIAVS